MTVFLALLWSACVKAACKILVKLTNVAMLKRRSQKMRKLRSESVAEEVQKTYLNGSLHHSNDDFNYPLHEGAIKTNEP